MGGGWLVCWWGEGGWFVDGGRVVGLLMGGGWLVC